MAQMYLIVHIECLRKFKANVGQNVAPPLRIDVPDRNLISHLFPPSEGANWGVHLKTDFCLMLSQLNHCFKEGITHKL